MSDERTVWYRKWRPQTFAEVTGQEHVTRTLRNAVAAGRVAHAYLLCGPRGTGKTTTARLLAKAVNCATPQDGEPCDRCDSCVAVREGRALDLVEMDAASNRGIDDIRELRERVGYAASGGRFKVYLIDEVHELTQQAFDALLKTLEEPPAHVIFVLATTDAHRVPATIVSRCQRFDLTRARLPDLVARLREIATAEGVAIDDEALHAVARAATGSFRDAVGLLEQLVASYGQEVSPEQARAGLGLTGDARALDLARAALEGDLAGGLALIGAVRDDGVDLRQFTREVVARLRSLLLLRAGVEDSADGDGAEMAALTELAAATDMAVIARALKAFGSADFRADPQASLPLELALVAVALKPGEPEAAAPTFAEARQARRAAPAADQPAADQPAAIAPTARTAPIGAAPTPAATSPASPGRTAPTPATTSGAASTLPPASPAPARAQPVDQLAALRERLAARDSASAPAASGAPAMPGVPAKASAAAAPATPVPPVAPPSADATPAASSVRPDTLAERSSPSPERPETAPPAAVPAETPTAGMNGAEPDPPASLAEARARYRDVYQHMQAASRLIASRLNGGDIIGLDGESVTFGLPFPIQVEKLAAGTDAYRALVDAVTETFGRRYTVHCVHMKDVEDRLRAQPTRTSHLLDEAIKLGARPLGPGGPDGG